MPTYGRGEELFFWPIDPWKLFNITRSANHSACQGCKMARLWKVMSATRAWGLRGEGCTGSCVPYQMQGMAFDKA